MLNDPNTRQTPSFRAHALWQNYGLSALTHLNSYVDVLQNERLALSTSDYRELLTALHYEIARASACWHTLTTYMLVTASEPLIDWGDPPTPVHTLVADAVGSVLYHARIPHITVAIAEALPPVRDSGYLRHAFMYLLCPYEHMPTLQATIPQITIRLVDINTLAVEIVTGPLPTLAAATELQPEQLYPGSYLHLAALIVQTYGSTITLQHQPNETRFFFALPTAPIP